MVSSYSFPVAIKPIDGSLQLTLYWKNGVSGKRQLCVILLEDDKSIKVPLDVRTIRVKPYVDRSEWKIALGTQEVSKLPEGTPVLEVPAFQDDGFSLKQPPYLFRPKNDQSKSITVDIISPSVSEKPILSFKLVEGENLKPPV